MTRAPLLLLRAAFFAALDLTRLQKKEIRRRVSASLTPPSFKSSWKLKKGHLFTRQHQIVSETNKMARWRLVFM